MVEWLLFYMAVAVFTAIIITGTYYVAVKQRGDDDIAIKSIPAAMIIGLVWPLVWAGLFVGKSGKALGKILLLLLDRTKNEQEAQATGNNDEQ